MPSPEGQRAYLMLDQPKAYFARILPEVLARTPRLSDTGDQARTIETLEALQNERWEKSVGIPAKNSKFTVVLPIYDEEKTLSSTLAALMLSDIPPTVEAQFLFIVNGSHDRSAEIVKHHLATIAPIEAVQVQSEVDVHVNRIAYRAKKGATTFTLIETPTPNKANALNIANEIALSHRHDIAICIDSDRYLEPSTIPLLYADAYRAFATPENRTVVADGALELERKQSLFQRIIWKKPVHLKESGTSTMFAISGSIHAWNTQFLHDIGGMKKVLIEDFALGLDAHMHGYIAHRSTARAWGYKPNSLLDIGRERVRFYRGFMQLQEIWKDNPSAINAIAEYSTINYPLSTRVRKYLEVLWANRSSPKTLTKQALTIAFQECCKLIAIYRHSKNPHAQTWVQIQSSK